LKSCNLEYLIILNRKVIRILDWSIELAKLFKERNNKKNLGPLIGKIVELSPLKISILDGQALLENVYILKAAKKEFKIGMEVLIIANTDNQTFFVIGEVTKN